MRKRRPTTLIAVLLAAMLVMAGRADAARADWHEMTVGHFHLYSTLRDAQTRNIARQLQLFEQTVGKMLQSDDGLPDVPTLIYILDQKDFRKYAVDRPGLGGFFHEGPSSNVLVIDGEMDFDAVRVTVFHEYTHFIQRNTRSMRLPPWFVEGYAELFSSFRPYKDSVTIGELPHGVSVSLEPKNWIPMERLLAVKQSDPEYRSEHLMPQFYGEAWALAHLLMFDDKALGAPTRRYLESMDVGIAEPEAFASAFPFDKKGLDEALHKLIKGERIVVRKITYRNPVEVDEAPITRITAAEADAAMARLLFLLRRPAEVIDPWMQSALAEGKSDPATLALGARISARVHDKVDVEEVKRLALAPDIPTPQRIDLADAALGDGGTAETGRIALALLDGMVHAPDPPIEAVMLWVRAAELSDVPPPKVIDVLEPASKRAPHNTQMLQWLAISNEQIGAKARARELYTRIILVSKSDGERVWAQKQADSERLQDDPPPPPVPAAPAKAPAKPKPKPAKR